MKSETEEQKIARQTGEVDRILREISRGGNCWLEAVAVKDASCGDVSKPLPDGIKGAVMVFDDGCSVQYFRNPEELGEFIKKLYAAGKEAWGPEPMPAGTSIIFKRNGKVTGHH